MRRFLTTIVAASLLAGCSRQEPDTTCTLDMPERPVVIAFESGTAAHDPDQDGRVDAIGRKDSPLLVRRSGPMDTGRNMYMSIDEETAYSTALQAYSLVLRADATAAYRL